MYVKRRNGIRQFNLLSGSSEKSINQINGSMFIGGRSSRNGSTEHLIDEGINSVIFFLLWNTF